MPYINTTLVSWPENSPNMAKSQYLVTKMIFDDCNFKVGLFRGAMWPDVPRLLWVISSLSCPQSHQFDHFHLLHFCPHGSCASPSRTSNLVGLYYGNDRPWRRKPAVGAHIKTHFCGLFTPRLKDQGGLMVYPANCGSPRIPTSTARA